MIIFYYHKSQLIIWLLPHVHISSQSPPALLSRQMSKKINTSSADGSMSSRRKLVDMMYLKQSTSPLGLLIEDRPVNCVGPTITRNAFKTFILSFHDFTPLNEFCSIKNLFWETLSVDSSVENLFPFQTMHI